MNSNPIDYKTPNSLAAIWSMMLPGLGQMMKARPMAGIFWAILVSSGYFSYFWPGITLHICCILDAAFNGGEAGLFKLDTWYRKIAFLGGISALLIYVVIRNDLSFF